MKKIVAAVDFSNATPGVLEASRGLAAAYSAELHIIHIVEPEAPYTAYGFTPEEFPAIPAYHEELKVRAGQQLQALAADLPGVTAKLLEGTPLHTLLEYVEQTGADLVVLGSHGHGVLGSLLLGSVAEGIVRKAVVPTLIIPAPKEE